ncbi:MAG: Flp pilus assembly complex ATPase component TadA [Clostridia bacterium]|nr:Flp pilus assembly complex ATPase component TadA [Clostridia bacterium]
MFENIKNKKTPIGVDLVNAGLITEEQLDEALKYQKSHPELKLGEIVDIQNVCDKEKLLTVLAKKLGERAVILDNNVDIDYKQYMSRDSVINNRAFPFSVQGNTIKVAFANPSDLKLVDSVRLQLLSKGYEMEKYITLYSMIMGQVKNVKKVQDKFVNTDEKDTTILVDNIILTAIKQRASDIHVEPMENKVRVRYRIDGDLVTVSELPKARQSMITGRLKSISNMHQEISTDQDGRINDYENYSIRVSTQKNINGEKFVLRLLKKNGNVRKLFDLGFPNNEELVKKAFDKRNSLIIMCAPTGEGKTTTLYSILDYLNRPDINVVTIENPVEIRMPEANQVEIGYNVSFAGALRTVLRQDPNIILVGEIRDTETAKTAIEAGQTGHLVLTTIHTIDAIETITRIRKMGISDYDVSSSIVTVVSQRLVRQLCPECKKAHKMTKDEKEYFEKVEKITGYNFDLSKANMYEPVGCKHCGNTGFYERTGIFEILCIDEELKEKIAAGASAIDLRKYAVENTEYKPLIVDAVQKCLDGMTTIPEIEKKIVI